MGLDIEEAEMATLQEAGLEVYIGNAEEFDLDRSFDVIVAGELIEHLSNPGQFLQRCREHLRENRRVVTSTPNLRDLQILYWFATGGESRMNPEHTTWFDQYVLDELAERHSFVIDEWTYYTPSISLVPRPAYELGLLRPITAGGFVLVLRQSESY